jgi:hypothetical protein
MSPDRTNAAGTLYWSTGDSMKRSSTEGDCRQIVQPTETNAEMLDMDVDFETGQVFFNHGMTLSTIRRCDLDGGNTEVVYVAPPGTGPAALDIDRVNRKLYWTEDGGNRLMRSNLDGSTVEQVLSGFGLGSYGIAVDPAGGLVYWAQHSFNPPFGSIHRVNFDGTGHEQIAVSGQVPFGIAVHHASAKVYWTDGGLGSAVYRADLDFSNVEQIVSGLFGLRGIDIDEAAGKLYFGRQVQPADVFRCDLDGGGLEALGLGGAYGIACVPEKFGFVCPGDTNQDLSVNVDDLLSVINSWGPCQLCAADFNGDGTVNVDDLLFVLEHWTV